MFQVTPDQEKTILIGDMLSDGLLIVELLPSPSSTPAAEVYPSIDLPGEACGTGNTSDSPTGAAQRSRSTFGRNISYGKAIDGSGIVDA